MRIRLSPRRLDDALSASIAGDIITINGEAFDFSGLPDGATIPADTVPCYWIEGPVERIAGELCLTLVLPFGPSPSMAMAFPAPIINPPDGPLDLPADPPPPVMEPPSMEPPTLDEESINVDA